MRAFIIILLNIIFTQLSICQIPVLVDTLNDEMSPQNNIEILHSYNQPLDRYEIWLVDANDSTKVFLLDSTSFQNATVIFSPNEQWIAENIEIVSNYRTVILFKRVEGVQFEEVKDAQIEEKSWRLFAKNNHLANRPNYDHTAASIVSWANNSATFLVEIEGHGDIKYNDMKHYLSHWYCNYDVNKLIVTLNRAKEKINRKAFHR